MSFASFLFFCSYKLQRNLNAKELQGSAAGTGGGPAVAARVTGGSGVVRKGQKQPAKRGDNLVLEKPLGRRCIWGEA